MPAGLVHSNVGPMPHATSNPLAWADAEVPDPPKWPPVYRRPMAYVDIETTGLSRSRNTILEVAVIRDDTGPWETKIKPNAWEIQSADAKAMEIVGYSDEEWADAPTLPDVMPELAKQLHGVCLIGHNVVEFDHPFLHTTMQRLMWHSWLSKPYLDTMIMARQLLQLRRNNLDAVCEHLGLEPEGTHRAMGGAKRVKQVCEELRRRIGQ